MQIVFNITLGFLRYFELLKMLEVSRKFWVCRDISDFPKYFWLPENLEIFQTSSGNLIFSANFKFPKAFENFEFLEANVFRIS